jgi:hypothetical protein
MFFDYGDVLMLKIVILVLAIFIILSGCVEESEENQSNKSVHQRPINITPQNLSSITPSIEENIPKVEVTSFSSIHMHDNSENVFSYLFSWDNVPGNESHILSDYLMNDLGIDWVSNAEIIKTDDNNTIHFFTPNNSLELKLADDKNTILITPNHIQLKVKKEDSRLCVYKVEKNGSKTGYNFTERYYAVYGLSIKNNGSNNLDFKLNEFHVCDGDRIYNTTILDPYGFSIGSHLDVLSNLIRENKIENTTLSPGQTINGSVVFQVNSLYNESFLLMYNETSIPSKSFEKSIEALRTAERYNYSVSFGTPPYNDGDLESFEPNLIEYPCIYSSWINRSVFEFFNKVDLEDVLRSSPNDIHLSTIVYALKVIPERNITLFPVIRSHSYPNKTLVDERDIDRFLVVDDIGEELIDTLNIDKIAILRNQTYELYPEKSSNIPQMNLSNATIVRTSFGRYGNLGVGIYCYNNQDVILDDYQNMIVVRSSNFGVHFP